MSSAPANGIVPATSNAAGSSHTEPAALADSHPAATSVEDDAPLFSPSLISPAVSAALPPGYRIRPLQHSDYTRGFLEVLSVLTTVGDISAAAWSARYSYLSAHRDSYFVLVIVDPSRPPERQVVGTGTVLVERKFIHELGSVGHIEDIAVDRGEQGRKLGLRIIQALDFLAEKVGCYKTILDCSEANEGFYVKCNFRRAGLEMARYYDMTGKTKSHV